MDTNPLEPGLGSILGGLALVLGLGVVVLLIGIWVASQFRRGRVNEETDISYPSVPQGEADRRAVEAVQERERATGERSRPAPAVESGQREVSQTPSRAERPVDAADRRDDPVLEGGQPPRNPL